MLKIAHRGGVITERTPEGSLAAIQAAVDYGYDMVELDIRRTKDDHALIHHDETFERTCGIRKRVSELTSEEIKNLRLSNTEETVPELKDALEICYKRIGSMLEMKEDSEKLCQTVYKLLEKKDVLGSTIIFPNSQRITEVFEGNVKSQIKMDHFDNIKSKKNISGLFLLLNFLGIFRKKELRS